MKIIVVFKTHFDIGFTGLATEVVNNYSKEMLDDILKACEDTKDKGINKKYVWTMASWPFIQTIKLATPNRKERAIKAIHDNQLITHALPFTIHTEFGGVEELHRMFKFARDISLDYQKDYPISAKMTDVPGHTLFLASLLSKSGVKFLHLGANPASKTPDVPQFFWWEGLDKNKVLTFYSQGAYGSTLMPPKNWPYPVWLAIMQTNDNIGPQSPEILDELQKTLDENNYNADLIIGSMDDFYKEISKYDLSDLPVVKKDLADTWIHGIGSYPKEVSSVRRNRNLLQQLEIISSLLNIYNINDNAYNDIIDDAYENSLLFTEHTWGLDVKSTLGYDRFYSKKEFNEQLKNSSSYHRIEKSWDEQRERSTNLLKNTTYLFKEIADKLPSNNEKVTLYNTNLVDFNGYINLPKTNKFLKVKNLKGLSSLNFNINEFKPLDSDKNPNNILENDYIYLKINEETGQIQSLKNKSTNKNWINTGGYYQYEIAGNDKIRDFIANYTYRFFDWSVNDFGRMNYPEIESKMFDSKFIKIDKNNNEIKVVFKNPQHSILQFGNSKSISIIYTLFDKRLNIKLEVNEKEATPIIEMGHFMIGLNVLNPKYKINKVNSLLNLDEDIVNGGNHALYCLENYLQIEDEDESITVVSKDTPLFSIGESSLYKFKPFYSKPKENKLFFSLFNNMWGTNFPQWIKGDFNYEFDIILNNDSKPNVNEVINLIYPPILLSKVEFNSNSFITNKNINITTIKKSYDNLGYVIRFKEIRGENIAEEITFPNTIKIKSAMIVDNFESVIKPIKISNNTIKLSFNPFEIINIYLKI